MVRSIKPFLKVESLTAALAQGISLTDAQAEDAARLLASPDVPTDTKRDFLIGLSKKGETAGEVAAFARVFREMARDPGLEDYSAEAIDVVGTGGDNSGSFNISSTVALILAAGGIPVIKHGNRSITSKSGSADILAALGIAIQEDPQNLRSSLQTLNFCFLFAPSFHPAFKEIMPVRREMAEDGKRSIFNLLGPLINPANPAYLLMGVYSQKWVYPVARSLDSLGLKRGLVVYGHMPEGEGMDELTCVGENRVAGVGELADIDAMWSPETSGFDRCKKSDLKGGSAKENAEMLFALLDGKGNKGLVDTLLYNAGVAFWICGKNEGFALARDILLGGALKNWLEKARDFYAS